MIKAEFFRASDGRLLGFDISGHAGMDDYGRDIACASVSSAVMLTANTLTEAFKVKAKVSVEDNRILLKILSDSEGYGDKLILGCLTHMYFLSDEFPGRIFVRITEKTLGKVD